MPAASIEPSAFLSDCPPSRIIGVECEYNIQNVDNDGNKVSLSSYINESTLRKAGLKNHSSHLGNGARRYSDVGHLEYDTPESLGPKQAAEADWAGILVMQDIIEASGLQHQGLFRLAGTSITKSTGAKSSETSGTHKNYMLPRSVSDSKVIDRLIPGHLATELYAMSGTVRDGYVFSQKVSGIGGKPIARTVERRTAKGKKPMAIIPPSANDADTIGNPKWARLEVRLADPVISPRALFLGLAATSVVLRLAEHPKLLKPSLFDFVELANPVRAAQIFSKDLTLSKTVLTCEHKEVTLLDVQEAYLEAAIDLTTNVKLPVDEQDAISLWIDFCYKLKLARPDKNDYGKLVKEYDFAARHYYLAKSNGLDSISQDNPKVVEQNLIWDRVCPKGGGLTFWEKFPSQVIDQEEILKLKSTAPEKTRAKIRADIINDDKSPYEVISWAVISNGDGEQTSTTPT